MINYNIAYRRTRVKFDIYYFHVDKFILWRLSNLKTQHCVEKYKLFIINNRSILKSLLFSIANIRPESIYGYIELASTWSKLLKERSSNAAASK